MKKLMVSLCMLVALGACTKNSSTSATTSTSDKVEVVGDGLEISAPATATASETASDPAVTETTEKKSVANAQEFERQAQEDQAEFQRKQAEARSRALGDQMGQQTAPAGPGDNGGGDGSRHPNGYSEDMDEFLEKNKNTAPDYLEDLPLPDHENNQEGSEVAPAPPTEDSDSANQVNPNLE